MTRRGRAGRREAAGHIDDWLMTYADTITLLLCLFVVFVIASNSRRDHREPAPAPHMPEVTAQIRPPVQPPQPAAAAVPPDSVGPASVAYRLPPAPEAGKPRAAAAAAASRVAQPSPRAQEGAAAGVVPVAADDATSRALAVIPPPELAEAAKAPDTTASTPKAPDKTAAAAPTGDRVTTLDMGSAAFFDSGSAALSDAGKAILRGILPRLVAALVEGYRIKVEGHTDDSPIDTAQFPSNWELSAARASAVVHFYIEQGVPAQRLRAIGYADTEPKAPDRDAAGNPIPQNQAENRRVVIALEKIERPGR